MKKLLSLMLVIGMLSVSVITIQAAEAYIEKEPNDYFSTANVFDIGKSPIHIFGFVNEQDERDHFKLVAEYTGMMEIDFTCRVSTDGNFDFYIKNSDGRILKKWGDISGNFWEVFETPIEKGDYLHVYIDRDAGQLKAPYDIEVDID